LIKVLLGTKSGHNLKIYGYSVNLNDSMKFRNHLPSQCPPSDAIPAAVEVYYLVSDPPTENDFLSIRERNPNKDKYDDPNIECQCCGLSVFPDRNGVELAKNVSRSLKNKKVAKGNLSEESGKLKNTPSRNTGDTHHTWWPNREVKVCQLFAIISQES
jgi:hypothetical protein